MTRAAVHTPANEKTWPVNPEAAWENEGGARRAATPFTPKPRPVVSVRARPIGLSA